MLGMLYVLFLWMLFFSLSCLLLVGSLNLTSNWKGFFVAFWDFFTYLYCFAYTLFIEVDQTSQGLFGSRFSDIISKCKDLKALNAALFLLDPERFVLLSPADMADARAPKTCNFSLLFWGFQGLSIFLVLGLHAKFSVTSAFSPLTLSVVCFFVDRFWNLLPMSWPLVSRVWSNCCFHSLYSLTLSLVCSLIFSLLLWLFLMSFLDFFNFFLNFWGKILYLLHFSFLLCEACSCEICSESVFVSGIIEFVISCFTLHAYMIVHAWH